ncbi:MAG TPA: DUF4382 domain-containing protein [Salinimicrobium sp.]|nr:DUF4382 domain-containing protein [Salinimicrobium sp.]
MNRYKLILCSVLFSAGLLSCSNDDETKDNPEPQTANVTVALTDAPGDYEKVFVQVTDVMVKMQTEEDPVEGWQSLGNINEGKYDLLTLTGGKSQLLAETELPPGHLKEMRLVLGGDNTIVVEGIPYNLTTPSAEQSGLKLMVDEEIEAGLEYNFVMDFNVEESVVETGSGKYILKPVIRLFLEQESGSISGSVSPAEVQTLIEATDGTTTVTAYTDAEGDFELKGLPAGTYEVTVTPAPESNFPILTYNNVNVVVGETTDMGQINID